MRSLHLVVLSSVSRLTPTNLAEVEDAPTRNLVQSYAHSVKSYPEAQSNESRQANAVKLLNNKENIGAAYSNF